MDRIKRLRWQQRSLPDSIKINLGPQEIQVRRLPEHGLGLSCSHIRHTCIRGQIPPDTPVHHLL